VEGRINSLELVWELAVDNSFIGAGYNRYQYVAQSAGLIGDFQIHSRAGAENSLLTLWVTTGVLGVGLFFVPWLALATWLVRRWWLNNQWQALAAAFSIVALFVQSQFINSFLYAHLLAVLALVVAMAVSERQKSC